MRNPYPEHANPLRRALSALLAVGRNLLLNPAPKRARTKQTAEQRIARTIEWLTALAATLAGDRAWLRPVTYAFPRFPGRYPALTAKLRAECGLPPIPPPTPAQKAAAQRRYMQKVFATQPTGKIAARLARRLGVTQTNDAWPQDLIDIAQTPVAWAKTHAQPSPRSPDARPAPPTPSPTQTPTTGPPDDIPRAPRP